MCAGGMKSNETTRQVPVIFLTALDDAAARLKGIESRADDFISKPADEEELLAGHDRSSG